MFIGVYYSLWIDYMYFLYLNGFYAELMASSQSRPPSPTKSVLELSDAEKAYCRALINNMSGIMSFPNTQDRVPCDIPKELTELREKNLQLISAHEKDKTEMQRLEKIRQSLELQIHSLKTSCATYNRQLIDKEAMIVERDGKIQKLNSRSKLLEERLAKRNAEICAMKLQVKGHFRFMKTVTQNMEKAFGPYDMDIDDALEGGAFSIQPQNS